MKNDKKRPGIYDTLHTQGRDYIMDDIDEYICNRTTSNIADCQYEIPTHWDIGKVYKRLILEVCNKQGKEPIDTLIEVYNSWLSARYKTSIVVYIMRTRAISTNPMLWATSYNSVH